MRSFFSVQRLRPLALATAVGCVMLSGCGGKPRHLGSINAEAGASHAASPESAEAHSVDADSLEGAGSSGGGHGATVQGKLFLRELVEGTVCNWVDGPTFFKTKIAGEKDWQAAMLQKKIGFLFYFLLSDQPMLRAYYEEAVSLQVCLSKKPLRALPENIDQSVTAYQTENIDTKAKAPTQIAIRIGDTLFIDQAAYEKLDATNQEYLQFHEILHAFIPMQTPGRMTRLRDFVAGVRAIDLKFPRREDGTYAIEIGVAEKEHRRLVHEYELLKDNNRVNVWTDEALAPLALVSRYVLLGNLKALEVVFDKNKLHPMQMGATKHLLFDELVFELRECVTGDDRPMCVNAEALLRFYLDRGADPDMKFTTGEWEAMPIWEYLLRSMNRTEREPRLKMAEILFKRLVANHGGMKPAMQARLDAVLLRLCRDNFLGQSVEAVLRWGANPNAKNEAGNAAILVAVEEKGHGNNLFHSYPATEIIASLIFHGADLSAKNAAGKTALEVMKDFKGARRPLHDSEEIYQLGVKALEKGGRGLEALRPEFEKLRLFLPKR